GEVEEVRAQLEALPVHPALLSIPQIIFFGATLNAVFAFGEELGWRGLMYRELRPLGFWSSSFLIGVLWGLWHAPLILLGHNYPDHPLLGIGLFTVQCAAMSPLYTLVRERSGSVWAAAVLHGTFNAAAGIPLLITQGGSPMMTGVTGVAGLIGLVMLNVLLWLATRSGTLTPPPVHASSGAA
ncbi:MAG: membrane protease YdiL (CAAX protease family), partial [Myxococcota bacterium]